MKTSRQITEQQIRDALLDVMDPEIPNLSIVDLGVVRNIDVRDDAIEVELMPTFVGCPALEVMKEGVRERLGLLAPDRAINVKVTLDEPWTTERITERGRQVLKSSGFAPPPPRREMPTRANLIQLMPVAECPYCNSRNTVMDNAFGPTLCRAIYYCRNCRQPFEQFKQV
ncbi:MAG TPA: 1,2-phenylacetyl-CoA epoxidase subunit PaaD [Chloroflexia bacterium]|nr:1,2-phenylacetyl-CoA epoxidase subunit PaaD [Chloroflexia bacterium]